MNTRDKFRKTIIRELMILAAFVIIGVAAIVQSYWVLQGLEKTEVYWSNDRSLPQNLAALGLAANEVNAVTMMESFKAAYPQYAEAGYKDSVGFYLSEFPAYPHREALYERITAAENKIGEAKRKLAQRKRIEQVSQSLKRAGFLVLALYPVTFAARFLLRMKRAKSPKIH